MENLMNEMNTNMPPDMPRKKSRLPLVALMLDVVPVVLTWLLNLFLANEALASVMIVVIELAPIAAIITGIVSLCMGKSRIGGVGVALAIIAIVLPILVVGAFVLLVVSGGIVAGM